MKLPVINYYESSQFTASSHDDGTTVLVAEASDLRYRGWHQIYDDACDVGISIKSSRTGQIVTYYLNEEEMDHSGEDVAGWRFKPIAEDVRRVPACANTSVLIIND